MISPSIDRKNRAAKLRYSTNTERKLDERRVSRSSNLFERWKQKSEFTQSFAEEKASLQSQEETNDEDVSVYGDEEITAGIEKIFM
jgi:ribosomal protein L14E/L6E/L27E